MDRKDFAFYLVFYACLAVYLASVCWTCAYYSVLITMFSR